MTNNIDTSPAALRKLGEIAAAMSTDILVHSSLPAPVRLSREKLYHLEATQMSEALIAVASKMVAPTEERGGVMFLEDTFSAAETKPLGTYLAGKSIIGAKPGEPPIPPADVPLPEPCGVLDVYNMENVYKHSDVIAHREAYANAKVAAALASQPKPAPVLLTDDEKREILKGAFGIDPAFDGNLMRMATDIESAVLRKQGWGV